MQFALVDSQRKEAEHGEKGICPLCSQPVIAKCGKIKINHWAHKSNAKCDSWSEPETEWHRTWKNNYPTDWQEKIMHDEKTNEKHIADVCTPDNLVLEFQHSPIQDEERISREQFYKNMVWIVDGTRLKKDFPRFIKNEKAHRSYKDRKDIFLIYSPEEHFLSSWLKSSAPVIFDFKGIEEIDDKEDARNYIYCLFPLRTIDHWFHEQSQYYAGAIFAKMSRSSFISATKSGKWSTRIENFMGSDSTFVRNKQEVQNQVVREHEQNKTSDEVEHSQHPIIPVGQPQIVSIQIPRKYGIRRGALIDDIEKKYFSKQFKPRGKRRR